MKPRYAEGTGVSPIHVASIRREHDGRGAFVLSGSGAEGREISFSSDTDFLELLHALIAESVALSVGGHCLGPAEEAALLISNGELDGSYVEISWTAPEHWTLREISKGTVPPWERAADPRLIANPSAERTLRLSTQRHPLPR